MEEKLWRTTEYKGIGDLFEEVISGVNRLP